jgi:hypothetical protein
MWVVTLHILFLYSDPPPQLMTFLITQANFKPTFSSINTLKIPKPSYYSSYLPACEDGTDRVFRNEGTQNSDAGELPRRKHTAFTTWRKLEIKETRYPLYRRLGGY